jgi:hypothetical protein
VADTIDIFVLWHVIEHLENPYETLSGVLKKGGEQSMLFLQVPQYCNEHIKKEHYYYFNVISIRKLLERVNYEIVDISFDTKNTFMMVVAKSRFWTGNGD